MCCDEAAWRRAQRALVPPHGPRTHHCCCFVTAAGYKAVWPMCNTSPGRLLHNVYKAKHDVHCCSVATHCLAQDQDLAGLGIRHCASCCTAKALHFTETNTGSGFCHTMSAQVTYGNTANSLRSVSQFVARHLSLLPGT